MEEQNGGIVWQSLAHHFKGQLVEMSEDNHALGENNQFNSSIVPLVLRLEARQVFALCKQPLSWQKKLNQENRPFFRETFWYSQVIPGLKKTYPEILDLSPPCFYCSHSSNDPNREDDDDGLIILQNMSKSPLELGTSKMACMDQANIVDPQSAKMMLETLATFHGIWLEWMNKKDPEVIGGFQREELLAEFGQEIKTWAMSQPIEMLTAIRKLQSSMEAPKEASTAIRKIDIEKVMRGCNLCWFQSGMETSRIKTMCHGDFWLSNILMSEERSQVLLIDFQLMSPAHPARDIWYFIYSATDSKWRKAHLEPCLEAYFATFAAYLKRAEIDMSYAEFRAELEERRGFGIGFGTQLLTLVLSPKRISEFDTLDNYFKWRNEEFSRPLKKGQERLNELKLRLLDIFSDIC